MSDLLSDSLCLMDNEMMKTNCIIKSRYVIGKYIEGLGERRKEKESCVTSLSQKRKQRSISPSSFFYILNSVNSMMLTSSKLFMKMTMSKILWWKWKLFMHVTGLYGWLAKDCVALHACDWLITNHAGSQTWCWLVWIDHC